MATFRLPMASDTTRHRRPKPTLSPGNYVTVTFRAVSPVRPCCRSACFAVMDNPHYPWSRIGRRPMPSCKALDTFVFDHIRAAITHRDVLLAGEHAVTLTTPIPDDELLTAGLARLDRKIDAVGAPNGAASSTSTRAGSSNSPKRSAAPQTSPPAEKNCSTSEPTSPTNEPRSPAATSSTAAARLRTPASTPSSTPSTTPKNSSCCAYTSTCHARPQMGQFSETIDKRGRGAARPRHRP